MRAAVDNRAGIGQPSIDYVSLAPVTAGTLLRQPSFLFFLLSRSLTRFASQIGAVAIGWQIYDLTGSAFELGMVGLVQFLPTALLVFVAGHTADKFRTQARGAALPVGGGATALFLCWGSYGGWLTEVHIFIATFVLGMAGAFESPTIAALLPLIAPQGSLQRATALSSAAAQVATITGPALGGIAFCVRARFALRHHAGVLAAQRGADRRHQDHRTGTAKDAATADDIYRRRPFHPQQSAILGTISLDLFAVLFGGVTALLPIYARDILHGRPVRPRHPARRAGRRRACS